MNIVKQDLSENALFDNDNLPFLVKSRAEKQSHPWANSTALRCSPINAISYMYPQAFRIICSSEFQHVTFPRVWHGDLARFFWQRASGKTYDDIADSMGLTNAYVAQVQTRKAGCLRLDGLSCHRQHFFHAPLEGLVVVFLPGRSVVTAAITKGLLAQCPLPRRSHSGGWLCISLTILREKNVGASVPNTIMMVVHVAEPKRTLVCKIKI